MRLQRFSLLFLAFYLTFIGGSSYYTLLFPVRVFHHIFITLLLGIWLLTRIRKNGIPNTPLNFPLYGLVIWWFITSILSIYPRMSLELLWFGMVHLGLFWGIIDLIRQGKQRLVFEITFIMAVVAVFISALEFSSWYFGLGILPNTNAGWMITGVLPSLEIIPNASLAMSISTLLAGYVTPLIIISIVWGMTTHQSTYRMVLWGLAVSLVVVLILTSSRGGILALISALGTFVLIQGMQHPTITSRFSHQSILAVGILALIIGMGGFFYISFARGNVGVSNLGRLDMIQGALKITQDNPIFGVGYGLFGRAFRDYRDPSIAQDKLASAHNLYLNIASETGLIGSTLAIIIFAIFIKSAYHNWQTSPTRAKQQRVEATLSALVGMATHSMVDVFTITPIVLIALVLIAYSITPLPKTRLVTDTHGHKLPAYLGLFIVLSYGIWLLSIDNAQSQYLSSLQQNTIKDALQTLKFAQENDPAMNLYRLTESYLLALENHPEAIPSLQESLSLEPTWDVGWLWLAYLHGNQLDFAKAVTASEIAYNINNRTSASIHHAYWLEQNADSNTERIINLYLAGIQQQVTSTRQLPLESFWSETPIRIEVLNRYSEKLAPDVQYRLWRVHNPQKAQNLIANLPTTPAEWWIVGEHALNNQNNTIKARDAFAMAITLLSPDSRQLGDYYVSLARAWLPENRTEAEKAIQLGIVYRPYFESVDWVMAQIKEQPAPTEQAQPSPVSIQETSAVLFSRPAIFTFPPIQSINKK